MSMIGKTLGSFECTALLGKGGMGDVYRAKDQKLGRDVAIKVLPEEFAKDADRVARFQREAKLLASLNHPNIAAIHGLEESERTHFLVLELVEGDTLADRLKNGAIPVEESLKLALQIAEALEAAHEKGVIHRDLKPANIKVTPNGKIKVLDFGLAKAFAGDQAEVNLSHSPTLSEAATLQGVILGTAAYMSPEQARGKPVDKRTDIWAFGCVLYEMLTGKAAFQGEDVTEILAAVVKSGVNLDLLPANIHHRVLEVITRCLQKDQKKRYGGIGEAQYEIEQVLADPKGVFVQDVTAAKPRKRLRVGIPWVAAAVALAAVAVWMLKPAPPLEPKQITHLEYQLPEGQQFNGRLAIAPDGSKFVYGTNEGLYLRSMDSLDARLISGTDKDSNRPFFSPDGQWIGYISESDQKLKKVAVSGGAPVVLCDIGGTVFGTSWYPEDTIVFSEVPNGIMRVSSNGGTPETLIKAILANLATEGFPVTPQMLPDGKTLLFTRALDRFDTAKMQIEIQSLESGERKVLVRGGAYGEYLPSGHIVYGLENNLFAVPFDLDKLAVTGGQVSILENVRTFALSDSGTLVYVPRLTAAAGAAATALSANTLVWVSKQGNEESLATDSGDYREFKISPDGTQVALARNKDGNTDIWVWDLLRHNMRRLTFDEAADNYPLWTPDSQRIVFESRREGSGVYWKAANGTGEVEKLASITDRWLFPSSWSGDENTLVLTELSLVPLSMDIGILPMEGDHTRKPLLTENYNESDPQVIPNGRYVAYQSDESGEWQIYVVSFPNIDEGKWQISTNGGISPRWSPDGRELFYRNNNSVMVAAVETEPAFKPENPKVLFEGNYITLQMGTPLERTPWDIHPDGKKFLMIKPPPAAPKSTTKETPAPAPQPKIIIVLNCFEELKDRVPVN